MSICYFPLVFPFPLHSINVVVLLYRCLQQRKLLILLKGNNRLSSTGQGGFSSCNSMMKSSLNFNDQQQLVSHLNLSTRLIIFSLSRHIESKCLCSIRRSTAVLSSHIHEDHSTKEHEEIQFNNYQCGGFFSLSLPRMPC